MNAWNALHMKAGEKQMPSNSKIQEKSHCSIKNVPVPQTVICPHCNEEAEIWTDEPESDCPSCKMNLTQTT